MDRVYPAPTIVVGVGRFGLAVLERLGEDWLGLKLSGADETVSNLRLVSVRPDEWNSASGSEEPDARWRTDERPAARVAYLMGDGDLPSRAFDFAVLRSLGLIRFRDGIYQVAIPRDDGPVDVGQGEGDEKDTRGKASGERGRSSIWTMRRRRYFEWLDLGADPIIAAEGLRLITETRQDADLFITPLLNRVRQGHSPRTVLATLGRCSALHAGYDPCPWQWLHNDLPPEESDTAEAERPKILPVSTFMRSGFVNALRADEHLASALKPLDGWKEWLALRAEEEAQSEDRENGKKSRDRNKEKKEKHPPEIRVPPRFLPRMTVPTSPVDPEALLGRDWRVSSWAGEESLSEAETYLPVEVTPFQLGFFDHDSRLSGGRLPGAPCKVDQSFGERLQELGQQVHRGLIRLWVDLQRTRASGSPGEGARRERSREHLRSTLQQCLEILGELVIRPIGSPPDGRQPEIELGEPPRPKSRVEQELPQEPSRFLAGMLVEQHSPDEPWHRLTARLGELGLLEQEEIDAFRHPLLNDLQLSPNDIKELEQSAKFGEGPSAPDGGLDPPSSARLSKRAQAESTPSLTGETKQEAGPAGTVPGEAEEPPMAHRVGIQALRRTLNHLVRELYDFSYLTRARRRPTRQPPRLTVAVVGDMSEPFARAALRPILREVHAELLRAFTPIFQAFREGFDRSLCVVPILWMPHPADPFKGESLSWTRAEEAVIIDTVHGIRHWVECVLPPGRRFIPQIFINSRVTDVSTLTLEEAIRQTGDFLSFLIRNDLSEDPRLRKITSGSGQDDLFSSFACQEIDFPALRCREYLANRLARDLLEYLKKGGGGPRKLEDDAATFRRFEPPELAKLVQEPSRALRHVTDQAGEERRRQVEAHLAVHLGTWARNIEEAYDDAFLRALQQAIHGDWQELTGRQGEVDRRIDKLRMDIAAALERGLGDLRRHSNRLIDQHLREDGLKAVLSGFERLHRKTQELFRSREDLRSGREELAERHTMPSTPYGSLAEARRRVEREARRKPDRLPMRIGLVAWGVLSAVLGAPLAHGVAYIFDLHHNPGFWELLLGPLGMLSGGSALFFGGWAVLRWHLRRRTHKVQAAIVAMAAEAQRLLAGSGRALEEERPFSIRSFLESRIEFTAAVAVRGFSTQILEHALADHSLANRLVRSVDVQAHHLQRRAEDLGVRKRPGEGPESEDLSGLLGKGRQGSDERRYLITEDDLKRYYATRIPREEDLGAELPGFLDQAGGTAAWREQACLNDSEAILGHGRQHFRHIAEDAVSEQYSFSRSLGNGLLHLVSTCYSNLGFGAEFRGFEGLDPDGIQVITDAALVLHPNLDRVFEKARQRPDAPPTTRTMEVMKVPIRPNAAYMLSLVQGIRVHSVRNLKRFESFHDRVRMPDDRTFPLTPENPDHPTPRPINLVSAYKDLACSLEAALRRAERRNGTGEHQSSQENDQEKEEP